ncbi:Ist1 domain-containing protein [Cucumis melo var. makuwa]|uniref:Ist1 domain-containing protein n=2 Tax=Cucumis melo TaxID=3656 RepID=A0A5D3CIP5_CUCMM|nr:Ist1 domain-containing protein [Cucumis melo var. makuwa]
MLNKSFKPAKCKTSLKLAVSRIKLLRNKKDVHIKQLKGDLAKLLEAGQDQTARIRVEHFVREEKSKEAYELIEIFCELIVARMPMIESQKNCPIDLKEAVSSVIFASPRCADIPELLDVRKHFKSKYGKEFVSAAVELRPECGVNRMLVEKLSAKAPDGQSKLKILTAIAEEYNIKWDPKSFGDSINPPADLLNGPNTFGKASQIQMESIGGPSSFDRKESSRKHVPFKSDERPHVPERPPEHSLRSEHQSQQSNFAHVNANQSNITGHHNSETSFEGMHRHSNSGEQNNYSSGRQQWSMDFKDATSAAKAAAESAELASLAARAAAELSSRGNISQPSSSEFQKSSSYNVRAEGPQGYPSVHLHDQQLPKDQVVGAPRKSSTPDDNWRDNETRRYMGDNSKNSSYPSSSVSNNDVNTSVTNFNAAERSSFKNSSEPRFSGSLGSSATVEKQPRKYDADTSVPSFNAADRYSFKNSFEPGVSGSLDNEDEQPRSFNSNISATNFNESETYSLNNPSESGYSDSLGRTSMEKQPRDVDVEYVNDQPFSTGFDRTSSYGDVRIENDSIKVPSHEKLGNDAYENPFAMDKPNESESNVDMSFNDHASVVFDDYGPDDDYIPDYDFRRRESIPDLSSPKEKVLINSSSDDTWIFNQNKNDSAEKAVSHSQISDHTSLFAETIGSFDDPSHSDELLPATFDHSDGSENEEESKESEIIAKENSSEFCKKQDLYSEKSEWTHNISHGLSGSLDEENSSMPSHRLSSELNSVHELKNDSPLSSPDIVEESTSDGCSGLNFGKLKGGRRNQKSNNKLPFAKNSSRNDSSSKQAYESDASKAEQSTFISSSAARTSFRSAEIYDTSVEERRGQEKESQAKLNSFNSNLDDSKEKFSDYTLRSDQEPYRTNVVDEISKKPAPTGVAVKYPGFHNDDDSDEGLPEQNMKNSPRRVIGLSRRTKASPRSPSPQLENSHRNPTSHEDIIERKAPTGFYATASPLRAKTGTRYSDRSEIPEQPQSSKPFKQTYDTKRSFVEERSRPSAEEQQYNYPPEINRQGNFESSKFSSSKDTTAAPVKTRVKSSNLEQPQSKKPSKPIPETTKSLHEERFKSPTKDLPSTPSPKLETQGNSESSKKEKTKAVEKASHVHPKLPDYDNFAAHFLALRQNNK